MRRPLLVLLTTLLFHICFAQNATFKGYLLDANNKEPLIGATVLFPEGKGAIADLDGKFKVSIPAGTYEVTFKYVGYEAQSQTISFKAGEVKTMNIMLVESSNRLNDVVVSAGKFEQKIGDVPVSIAVIKPTLIENKATTNPEFLVDQVPGCQVLENQVSIRGGSGFSYGSGSRVLLMIDDMPMLSGDAGDVKWNSLPIENMSQMEILKGASSVLYGSSALNGVINIRTAYPTDEPKTKINVSNGIYLPGFGTQKGKTLDGRDTTFNRPDQQWWDGSQYYVSGNFLHSRKVKENFDLVVGGNFLTDEGYRMGADEHRYRFNANTRWRSKKVEGLSYGLNANHNNSRGSLFFLWQNADSVLVPQGLTDTATTSLSTFQTYRTNFDPFITYYDSLGRKHNYRGRYFNSTNRNNTNQASTAIVYYNEYQFQQKFDNDLNLTAGIMNTYTNVTSQLYGDHNSNNVAVFGQLDKKWERITLTGGLRIEHYRIDTVSTQGTMPLLRDTLPVQPVFRLGGTYRAAEETYFRASFGEGYRFPTIAEKFIATNVGGLTLFPNPNVEPETGWSAELGLKQGFKVGNFKGYLDLAGFVTEYHNMMEFTFGFYDAAGTPWDVDLMGGYPTLDNYGAQSKNVENARISGAEVSVVGTGKIGEVNINLLAGYTYLNPQSLNNDSVYMATFSDTSTILKYRFRHMAKFDIEATYKKFSLGLSSRYNSFMENVDFTFVDPLLGNLILPGYTDYRNSRRTGDIVFDARASIQVTNESKVAVLVNNVLNREVSNRPGNVLPPRTLIFQYSFNF